MGDVRTDNAYSNMNSGRFANSDMDYNSNGAGPWSTVYRVIAITNIVINADTSSLNWKCSSNYTYSRSSSCIKSISSF